MVTKNGVRIIILYVGRLFSQVDACYCRFVLFSSASLSLCADIICSYCSCDLASFAQLQFPQVVLVQAKKPQTHARSGFVAQKW